MMERLYPMFTFLHLLATHRFTFPMFPMLILLSSEKGLC